MGHKRTIHPSIPIGSYTTDPKGSKTNEKKNFFAIDFRQKIKIVLNSWSFKEALLKISLSLVNKKG